MNIPVFNAAATCPKCGHDQVRTNYSAGRSTGPDACSYRCPFSGKHQEHLERCCERCHYRWPEAVLISEPAQAPAEEGE